MRLVFHPDGHYSKGAVIHHTSDLDLRGKGRVNLLMIEGLASEVDAEPSWQNPDKLPQGRTALKT